MPDAARRQRVFSKFEDALKRALVERWSRKQLEVAAEHVRAAKLSLFKGQREISRYVENPSPSEQNHLVRLEERERDWQSRTIDQILREYR